MSRELHAGLAATDDTTLNSPERSVLGGIQLPAPSGRPSTHARLIKNTAVMYLKTALTMLVSLYASRVALQALGVTDYGIFFVVAGAIAVLSFLTTALSTSTQRFLNFELGKLGDENARAVFLSSVHVHALLALTTVCLAETAGLWFMHHHMVIPAERALAADRVYQFAVATVALTILQTPYTASMIAYERFVALAYFDIAHAILRLLAALAIALSVWDHLSLYAALLCGATAVVSVSKALYCANRVPICRLGFAYHPDTFRALTGFAGWSLVESLSIALSTQGLGVLLNMFFGPSVNAAHGVGLQLNNATATLASNLRITASPEIIKTYSAGRHREFLGLVEQSSRLSFFLMLLLAVPIAVEINAVLALWLKQVPPFAADFSRLLMLTAVVNSLSFPLMTCAQASGRIRGYQICTGLLVSANLGLGYLALHAGAPPQSVFLLAFALACVGLFARLGILRSLVGLNMARYMRIVLLPAAFTALAALTAAIGTKAILPPTLLGAGCSLAISIGATAASGWFLCLSAGERKQAVAYVLQRVKRQDRKLEAP
jgi:O-antigen/teichoic acid export membrane protein